MSGVEQIKATIGENEAFATLPEQAEPCGKVRARDDFVFDSGGHVAVRGLSFGKTQITRLCANAQFGTQLCLYCLGRFC
tara:strand:- start:985 stop:1221 length:237 start_codon:yes stop_codon:yes gene_type:complete